MIDRDQPIRSAITVAHELALDLARAGAGVFAPGWLARPAIPLWAFSSDAALLACAGDDKKVRLWGRASGRELRQLPATRTG